jgi:hypothetical protein
MTTTSKIEAGRRALRSLGLHESLHTPILAAMVEHGAIPADGGEVLHAAASGSLIERVQAAAVNSPSIKNSLVFALGQLRQCGNASLEDILTEAGDAVSMSKLDKILANKSPEFRITARTALHRAGLID